MNRFINSFTEQFGLVSCIAIIFISGMTAMRAYMYRWKRTKSIVVEITTTKGTTYEEEQQKIRNALARKVHKFNYFLESTCITTEISKTNSPLEISRYKVLYI